MNKRLTPLYSPDADIQGGSTWEQTFRDASENMSNDDQPDEESEDYGDETELEAESEEEDDAEADEDQPDGESEEEAPAFNDDTEIDLGSDRQPVKLSELKEGYMRTSDYTKKTQELATQRKEVETQAESLKPIKEWHDHITQNPWLWQQLNAAITEFANTETLPLEEVLQDAQYGKYINHLLHENTKLKSENQKLSGDFEGIKLTTEMGKLQSELATEYGDLVTPEYMQSLQNRAKEEKLSPTTLKEIAEGHLAKEKLKATGTTNKKELRKAEAKAVQSIAETRKNAPAQPKATAQAPKQEVDTEGDWGTFFKKLSGR